MVEYRGFAVYLRKDHRKKYRVDCDINGRIINVREFKSKGKCAKWVKNQIILSFKKLEEK